MDIQEKILEFKSLVQQLNTLYKEIEFAFSNRTGAEIEEKYLRILEIHHKLDELYKEIRNMQKH